MNVEDLQRLALLVSGERNVDGVLQQIVSGLAAQSGVALARIWLTRPGDLCHSCRLRTSCPDQERCLHLVASTGTSVTGESWSRTDGDFRRLPLGRLKVGSIASERAGLLIADSQSEKWARPEWVQREGISSFVGQPLMFGEETLGVLAVFRRESFNDQEFRWLRMFADQAASAIANARAFSELQQQQQHQELLDQLLSALVPVLEVPQVFEQVSALVQRVIPHDMAALIVLDQDKTQVTLHAVSGGTLAPSQTAPVPDALRSRITEPWDHWVIEDVQEDPVARAGITARAGFKGVLRVPIRSQGLLAAVLEFSSRAPGAYNAVHALLAKRVADHMALALSHERLSEERKRAAALQERTDNLELLDGLLKTLSQSLDVRRVFEQLSAIARAVVAHDMLVLVLLGDDREHVTVHAIAGNEVAFPETIPMQETYRPWLASPPDFVIDDDVQTDPIESTLPAALAGYRGRLVVPFLVQGAFAGAVVFYSRAPKAYSRADVLVGRRITDHIALALSHQRLAEEAERVAEARERASVLERRVTVLTAEVDALGGHRRVVGESRAWKQVLKQATQVSGTDTTVLLLGESGTGKEVVARFIHRASARNNGPFVAINCAALPEQLLESELFGHERGAFTGAVTPKPGQLELAASGVLFLDEVSEMSLVAQAKFLRVLQEREFQRLGGTRVLKSNVRVIAATNRDLSAAIARGTFREDLYYRLNVFEIALPPLRDRSDDVLPLSQTFLQDIGHAFGRPPAGISRDARELLTRYHWPGNVRQLRNTLERAAILCGGGLITGEHLSLPVQAGATTSPPAPAPSAQAPNPVGAARPDAPVDLKSMERSAIEHALRQAKHNKSKAARALGLTRTQLYVRLRKHGLE